MVEVLWLTLVAALLVGLAVFLYRRQSVALAATSSETLGLRSSKSEDAQVLVEAKGARDFAEEQHSVHTPSVEFSPSGAAAMGLGPEPTPASSAAKRLQREQQRKDRQKRSQERQLKTTPFGMHEASGEASPPDDAHHKEAPPKDQRRKHSKRTAKDDDKNAPRRRHHKSRDAPGHSGHRKKHRDKKTDQ